jgi:mersacidin/lichenicidin family type 2 lantibiotic
MSNEEKKPQSTDPKPPAIPENPAGSIEIDEKALEEVTGGTTIPCGIIGGLTVLICQSILGGGTCQQGTSGCC